MNNQNTKDDFVEETDWKKRIEKCFLTTRATNLGVPTVLVNPDTLKHVVSRIIKNVELNLKIQFKSIVPWVQESDPSQIDEFALGWNACRKEILNKLKEL